MGYAPHRHNPSEPRSAVNPEATTPVTHSAVSHRLRYGTSVSGRLRS